VGVAATTWLPARSSDAVVLLLSSGSGYETLPGGPSAKALYFYLQIIKIYLCIMI
jgi:hypothetical protein